MSNTYTIGSGALWHILFRDRDLSDWCKRYCICEGEKSYGVYSYMTELDRKQLANYLISTFRYHVKVEFVDD